MVEVYGIRKPTRPRSVGLPSEAVSPHHLVHNEEHTKSFREITTPGCRRLKEEAFVLLRAQSYSHLPTQWRAITDKIHSIVLGHLVVDFRGVPHGD
jgi:hypothetical protein